MSEAAARFETNEVTLHKIVLAEYEKNEGDHTKTIAAVTKFLLKNENRHLLKEIVAEVVLLATKNNVGSISASHRRSTVDPSHGKAQVLALARGLTMAFLEFPLPGGKALKSATRAEIIEGSSCYEKQGNTMLHRARWLRLAAQGIPDDKIAGDVLTNERLTELWHEAEHG